MTVLVTKNAANNTMYGVQQPHTFFINIQWNCPCLNTRIKLRTNIIFSSLPTKIDKSTANAYACYEKYGK